MDYFRPSWGQGLGSQHMLKLSRGCEVRPGLGSTGGCRQCRVDKEQQNYVVYLSSVDTESSGDLEMPGRSPFTLGRLWLGWCQLSCFWVASQIAGFLSPALCSDRWKYGTRLISILISLKLLGKPKSFKI